MKTSAPKQAVAPARNQGIALIIVLAFLSIMIVMAVAFLTQARIERAVASYTIQAMGGRQLVRTAINAAMNDYSLQMAEAKLVMPPFNSDYDMFTSAPPRPHLGMSGRTIGQDGVDLISGEVIDWIPRKYTNAPYRAQTRVPAESEWILVREKPTEVSTGGNRILGRYAYVIFDMSGGIDANLIARDQNVAATDARTAADPDGRVRRSVRQVPMGLLPEVANAGQFKAYRRGWKGYDSLYTLIKLNDGKGEDGNGAVTRWQEERKENKGPALSSNLVTDLAPFSLSVFRGGRYSPGAGTWTDYKLCGAQSWSSELAPLSSQFASGWPSWINNAINDYTNGTRRIPIGTDYPSPKNVPMFNEINMSQKLTFTPDGGNPLFGDYELEVVLTPEFWYPFPSTNNINNDVFTMDAPNLTGGTQPGDGQIQIQAIMMAPAPTPILLTLSSVTPGALNVRAKYNSGIPYLAEGTTNFVYKMKVAPMAGMNQLAAGGNLQIVNRKFTTGIFLKGSGGNADMLAENLQFTGGEMVMQNAVALPAKVLEVTDPRLNHLPGSWVQQSASTLGKMNNFQGADKTSFEAEGSAMFCRNGPMQTPAELGYISTGKAAWETIDLCTPAAVDMLSTLVADMNFYTTWSTKGKAFYTNGTININTRSSNVLAAAFMELTASEVPGTTNNVKLKEDEARNLAASIMATTIKGTREDAFQAGTDWARVPAMQKNGALSKMGFNNNQRESLLRNTWGLFSPGNSLFTVVVVAQTINEAPDAVQPIGVWDPNFDEATGERRAVALVWRDPFKNGNNLHHEMFIRMFRYMNE